jgi:hypothetical protein
MRSVITHLRGNIIAILALFVAMAGSSYAAIQLPANSVGTTQLKENAVTTPKIKNGAVTGAKINLSTLGTVPSATFATKAGTANDANALEGHPASYFAQAGALRNVTVVRSSMAQFGPGPGDFNGYAQRPAGQRLTGGGVGLSGGSYSASYMITRDSGPTDSSGNFDHTVTGTVPTSWYGMVYRAAGTATPYVWAVCAS